MNKLVFLPLTGFCKRGGRAEQPWAYPGCWEFRQDSGLAPESCGMFLAPGGGGAYK